MNNQINKLYCRFVTGMTVEIEAPQFLVVQDVKKALSKIVNLKEEQMFIGFETTMLNDKDYLSDKGVTNQDTLHVITSQLTSKIQYMSNKKG